jgi:sec-independent protein translocase protein TatC
MWNKKSVENPGAEMGILEHLAELRTRLLYSFLAICAAAVISYEFAPFLFDVLSRPYFEAFPDNQLIGTGPAEAFMLKIKVALFSGILLSSPFLFLQLWLFVAPGLYENEKRLVFPFVFCTTALFVLGAWFCYRFVVPLAFEFFHAQYASIGVTPQIRLSEHLSMMMQTLVGFGAVFELPIIAFFLARLGLITHHTLIRGSRYAVVIIFIVSAVLTPPDVLSQLLMAGPICLLYAFSILVVKYAYRAPTAEHAESDPAGLEQAALPGNPDSQHR